MDHVSWSRFEKKYIFESFSKRITVFTDEFLKLNIVVKKEVFTVWVSHQTHLRIVTISTSVFLPLPVFDPPPPSTHLAPGLQGQDWLCGVVKFVTHTLLSIWIRFWMRVPSSAWLSRGIDVFGGIFAHSLGLLVGASGPSEYMGTVRICSLLAFSRYIKGSFTNYVSKRRRVGGHFLSTFIR